MPSRLLLWLSAAAGALYLLSRGWPPFPGSALVKGCAVGALAVMAWLARRDTRDASLVALALALSAAGDVLLDLDPRFFVFGLGAFLLAHLTYIGVFLRNRARSVAVGLPRLAAAAVVIASSIALSVWIVPSVGALAVPVVLYICALTTMVSTAILGRFQRNWVAVGAVLFLISDSLLAVDRFKTPIPWRDVLVWSTYYLGQCGIALGYLASMGHTILPDRAVGTSSSAPKR